jgi:hypothetical protein
MRGSLNTGSEAAACVRTALLQVSRDKSEPRIIAQVSSLRRRLLCRRGVLLSFDLQRDVYQLIFLAADQLALACPVQ